VTDGEAMVTMTGVGKRYVKYADRAVVGGRLLGRGGSSREGLWALRNIDLSVGRGERVGIVGRNGAGKSTLIQLLAGVTAPTEGRVHVRGRVAPLVAVGVGFHPELTGRENIYVNGAILGMDRRAVDSKLDAIIAFSEVEDFIDTPVKFYSSGMYVRLGFSVAIHSDPDVLLVDEVLAVGDLAFQVKCFDRMTAIANAGTTVVVVSHNLNAIRLLCSRALVLHRGERRFEGAVSDAIGVFHSIMEDPAELDDGPIEPGTLDHGTAIIESFELLDSAGRPSHQFAAGDELLVRLRARFEREVVNPVFAFGIVAAGGIGVYNDNTRAQPVTASAGSAVEVEIRLAARLPTGSYGAWASVRAPDLSRAYARAPSQSFYVSGRGLVSGLADLEARFDLREVSLPPR